MKLIVNVNIVISAALNFSGKTRELIFLEDFELFAPDFLLSELEKNKSNLIERFELSEKEFNLITSIILSKIKLVSYLEFQRFLGKARQVCPDENDEEYFALALALSCPIWSNDKDLKIKRLLR